MSFILDALRKSEHERQQSAAPGLLQVPLATPQPQLPRWALVVMGVLAATALVLGGAWWQSSRLPAEPAASIPPRVERRLELPPPAAAPRPGTARQQAAPTRLSPQPADAAPGASSLAAAAASSETEPVFTEPAAGLPALATGRLDLPADAPALPSAAALAAEGIAVPALRLELHAFSGQPADRFVFINGRKYVEGERLLEGPELVSIEPTGAVLAHAGRRFVLVQE